MVRPQTARRRQRVQQQAQHTHHAQHQAHDDIGGMHDEADIMSFRSAATQRFILNQELIENLTEKWVHVDKIVKPAPFANLQPAKTDIKEIRDELYFGNLDLMKQKLELSQAQVKSLEEDMTDLDKYFEVNKHLMNKTEELGQSFVNKTPVDQEQLLNEYSEKTSNKVIHGSYTIRQIAGIRNDTSEASATYWDDLKRAREEEARRAAEVPQQYTQAQDTDITMGNNYDIPTATGPVADQLAGFEQTAGGYADLGMMDDVNFGLDDQDFLSQM